MKDIYDRRKGQRDEPHRHDYYTVLLIKKAMGKHIVDFNEYPLKSYQAFFIFPVHGSFMIFAGKSKYKKWRERK